ncbi:MAG: hypothetical protein UY72_C0005G0001 [Candidatus Uhrbacteria bacterium GW2011_GWD2_52_7]|uniref:Uncharacterized protein n=1 Tax=Candidatus Uhrbacteria bacterium GW2011_GWD2_52_7 TaxID=1618989 RepID=A0A0G1XIF6_9BACT|nr:MAG: hypothetical protein UY72_C0005G0001 [Candidatus Uhrbacteria bacterium GW2011_GWD2_52_7]
MSELLLEEKKENSKVVAIQQILEEIRKLHKVSQDQLSKTTKYHFHASFTLTEKFAHEPEIELEIRDDTTEGVISQIFSNS